MTDVASAPDSVQNKPGPGLVSRLIGVLLSPRETFAAVVARPRWLGVLVVTMVMTSAGYYLILSSQDMQDDPGVYRLAEPVTQVDLTAAIREEVGLAVPTYALCREACAGLCPRCGADLNEGPCACGPAPETT